MHLTSCQEASLCSSHNRQPSHATHLPNQQPELTRLSPLHSNLPELSSYPFPFGPGPEPAIRPPVPFSVLPRHPVVSAVSKNENLQSLASMWPRDPRTSSSVVPKSQSPTPAVPCSPQIALSPPPGVGSSGLTQPDAHPTAILWGSHGILLLVPSLYLLTS